MLLDFQQDIVQSEKELKSKKNAFNEVMKEHDELRELAEAMAASDTDDSTIEVVREAKLLSKVRCIYSVLYLNLDSAPTYIFAERDKHQGQ
jgi:hypothetical protein